MIAERMKQELSVRGLVLDIIDIFTNDIINKLDSEDIK